MMLCFKDCLSKSGILPLCNIPLCQYSYFYQKSFLNSISQIKDLRYTTFLSVLKTDTFHNTYQIF